MGNSGSRFLPRCCVMRLRKAGFNAGGGVVRGYFAIKGSGSFISSGL